MDHLSLPFLPATKPSLQSIYNLYSEAFTAMAQVPPITTLQDNAQLCKAMAKMVEQHRDNIPILAKGSFLFFRILPFASVGSDVG